MAALFEKANSPEVLAVFAAGLAFGVLWPALAALFINREMRCFNLGAVHKGERASVADWRAGDRSGFVDVGGEAWRAVSREPLSPGDAVIVAAVDGLTLLVRPCSVRKAADRR